MLGYEDRAIERAFKNASNGTVVPEVLSQSEQERHTVMVESKAGSNLDLDQIERYSEVTTSDLVQRAMVTRDASDACDTVIIGEDPHVGSLIQALEQSQHAMPVLGVTDTGMALRANGFERQPIEDAFTPELPIPWDVAPMMFVPLDANSDEWEVADVVIPKTLAHMGKRMPQVSVEQLASEICDQTWSVMGKDGKGGIRSKITQVLKEAAEAELAEWYTFEAGGGQGVKFQNNPFQAGPRQQTSSLDRLKRAHEDFRKRLHIGTQLVMELRVPDQPPDESSVS